MVSMMAVVAVVDERQEASVGLTVQQVRSIPLGVRSGQDNTKIPTRHEFSPGLVKHQTFVGAASSSPSFSTAATRLICFPQDAAPRVEPARSEGTRISGSSSICDV